MTTTAYHRIWQTVSSIPYGRVATYGQIATLAGLPRQARRVGYALHAIPADSAVPWHRVINAKGMIAFAKDSEPYQRQQARLQAEGIEFLNGRIDLKRFGWNPTLDELLWGPPPA